MRRSMSILGGLARKPSRRPRDGFIIINGVRRNRTWKESSLPLNGCDILSNEKSGSWASCILGVLLHNSPDVVRHTIPANLMASSGSTVHTSSHCVCNKSPNYTVLCPAEKAKFEPGLDSYSAALAAGVDVGRCLALLRSIVDIRIAVGANQSRSSLLKFFPIPSIAARTTGVHHPGGICSE